MFVLFSSPPDLKYTVARMSVDRSAVEYNMNYKKRGLALIFNHELFDIPNLTKRQGTNIDCEKLEKTFENLGFEVTSHKDCKLGQLLDHISNGMFIYIYIFNLYF